jgi:hypothetical protein
MKSDEWKTVAFSFFILHCDFLSQWSIANCRKQDGLRKAGISSPRPEDTMDAAKRTFCGRATFMA